MKRKTKMTTVGLFQHFFKALLAFISVLIIIYIYLYHEHGTLKASFQAEVKNEEDYDEEDVDRLVEAEQQRRKSLLAKYCQSNFSSSAKSLNTFYFVVSENRKIIYCRTGKTGSTTTSALLYNLEHGYNMTAKELKINKGSITSRLLSTYNKEEIDHRVSSYYSIVVTRNPIERLASAWISRFLYNHHLRYNDRYGSMLQTVSNTSNTEIHYDYIAHTETLADDLRLFLRKVGVTNRDDILPQTKKRGAEKKLSEPLRINSIRRFEKSCKKV
ncbi:carbohydrate sulfotransferase 11-like [Branchiostoma floridae]|uniref:Carbohydrate sulfotransferase n=1 Tax=Branchiostoma floridae TaxID=7739 RepID=A0A9J7NBJ8_BRAFL|nr:carbohydrate sulfotransferase 11-like [Branchiostoma floridae]